MEDNIFDKVHEVDMKKTMEEFYIDYAMSVIASRLGSTLSPIRVVKVRSSSEDVSSSIVTLLKIRCCGSIVVSHNCSASISPRPLYR